MNFNQFAASFQNPEENIPFSNLKIEKQTGDVVLAGTVLAATKESCIIDINSVQYEIAPGDVVDIEVIPAPVASKSTTDKKATAKEEVDAATKQGPQVTLIKVNRNTILCRRVPVQAGVVASVGTWVSVIPPVAKAVEQPAAKV